MDVVKLVLEAGFPGRPLPRMNEAAFRAAVLAAQKARVRTTVHVSTDADVRLALEAGADGIEHVPADLTDETIRLLAAKKVTLTPTLGVFDPASWTTVGQDPLVRAWADTATLLSLGAPGTRFRELLENPAAMTGLARRFESAVSATARAAKGGVIILAGSDSGNPAAFHGPALIRELEVLVEKAGLTPREALAAATSRAADRLGQKDLGRIAPQAVADLVVLGSDPTADIRALRDVKAVYLGGLPLDRSALLETSPGGWVPGQND